MARTIFSVGLAITGPKKSVQRCFDKIESENFPEDFEFELSEENERSTELIDDVIHASFDYVGDVWPTYIPELISENFPDLEVTFSIGKETAEPSFVAGIYKNKVLSGGYRWEGEDDSNKVAWNGKALK